MGRAYAHRMIGAAAVAGTLLTIGDTQPINEAQARPLTQLETPEAQQEAWEIVVDTAPETALVIVWQLLYR